MALQWTTMDSSSITPKAPSIMSDLAQYLTVTGKVTEMSELLNRRGRKATICITGVDETKNRNIRNQ